MAKQGLTKNQEDFKLLLMKRRNFTNGVAKKIARQSKDGEDIKKAANRYKRQMTQLTNRLKFNTGDIETTAEKAFNSYKALMKKMPYAEKTQWRREEFYLYWITGRVLDYDPWESDEAFLGGDILHEGSREEIIGGIQSKSEGDTFRIAYDLKRAKTKMQNAGFSDSEIAFTLEKISEAWIDKNHFSYTDLNKPSNKIEFMRQYHEISRAKWYVIFFDEGGGYQALSFPASQMVKFATYFHEYLRPTRERSELGNKLGKGMLVIKTGIGSASDSWAQTLSAKNAIHYRKAENFYARRNEEYSSSEIKSYNANFHKAPGYRTIQNTYFAPIHYK